VRANLKELPGTSPLRSKVRTDVPEDSGAKVPAIAPMTASDKSSDGISAQLQTVSAVIDDGTETVPISLIRPLVLNFFDGVSIETVGMTWFSIVTTTLLTALELNALLTVNVNVNVFDVETSNNFTGIRSCACGVKRTPAGQLAPYEGTWRKDQIQIYTNLRKELHHFDQTASPLLYTASRKREECFDRLGHSSLRHPEEVIQRHQQSSEKLLLSRFIIKIENTLII
jgi:hypothetical protein